MAKKSKGKGKKGIIQVDFTGVEAGGKLTPPGEYVAEVVEVELKDSSEGKPYLAWTFKVVGDASNEGNRLYHNTSLQPQALWNLRQTLEALGIETQAGLMGLDIASYKGLQLGVEVDTEEYKGKLKSRVTDVFALGDTDEDEEDDDEDEGEEEAADEEEEAEDEEAEEADSDDDDDEDEDEDEDDDEEDEEEEAPAPRRRSNKARRG